MPPVVITGLGVCTPQGRSTSKLWETLNRGGVALPITRDTLSCNQVHQAQALAENASIEALKDAGFWGNEQIDGVDTKRWGCTFSASKPLFTGQGAAVVPPETINHHLRRRW